MAFCCSLVLGLEFGLGFGFFGAVRCRFGGLMDIGPCQSAVFKLSHQTKLTFLIRTKMIENDLSHFKWQSIFLEQMESKWDQMNQNF